MKAIRRLVIVIVALHVAYHLPPTLLQANKGSINDLRSWKRALQWILLLSLHVGTTYHLIDLQQQWLFFQSWRNYKIIVAIMNYINCYMFLFIKLRMYILRYIDFVIKMLQHKSYVELILTKWPCKLHYLDHVINIFLHDIHNRLFCVEFFGEF